MKPIGTLQLLCARSLSPDLAGQKCSQAGWMLFIPNQSQKIVTQSPALSSQWQTKNVALFFLQIDENFPLDSGHISAKWDDVASSDNSCTCQASSCAQPESKQILRYSAVPCCRACGIVGRAGEVECPMWRCHLTMVKQSQLQSTNETHSACAKTEQGRRYILANTNTRREGESGRQPR